jgi:hypothetical protein
MSDGVDWRSAFKLAFVKTVPTWTFQDLLTGLRSSLDEIYQVNHLPLVYIFIGDTSIRHRGVMQRDKLCMIRV